MTGNEMMSKICNFAYIMAIIGICTLGICPAFAMMSGAVCIVVKRKKSEIGEKNEKKLKISKILSGISLVLFVFDIILAYAFLL